MGNADCGRLSTTFLSLQSGRYHLSREKTDIPRRFRLWPKRIEVVWTAVLWRPAAKDELEDALYFLTSLGKPVWQEVVNQGV